MKIVAVGCDHAGSDLKKELIQLLEAAGLSVLDCGTNSESSVDYPDYGAKVASAVSRREVDRGILICGTGIGMSIVANKFKSVRAALCHDLFTAKASREHNDSNVLVLGGRILSSEMAKEIVTLWLNTSYSGGRHDRRLKKILDIEESLEGKPKKSTD
ncbi:MAG: ribose 5-phosphate isomerase B [Nitrospirae bacterium]|nr:ribose 5-phosphate isomerase B [Nitrospirota bacterium]